MAVTVHKTNFRYSSKKLHDAIAKVAKKNKRSVNSEINEALEQWVKLASAKRVSEWGKQFDGLKQIEIE